MKVKMKMKNVLLSLLLLIFITLLSYAALSAAPTGPDSITNISEVRRSNFNQTTKSISAGAGNLTKMNINVTVITSFWAGFYGNITGRITLDDLNNFTFYDWSDTNLSVAGNVFAANTSVSNWNQIECLNLTSNGSNKTGGLFWLNETILEASFGMTPTDPEGFGETFSLTNNITVDTVSLVNCPATFAYSNDSKVNYQWNQTLLTINNSHTVIFASNIEDNGRGFNNESVDFQLLVADRNTPGYTSYLLYVELV